MRAGLSPFYATEIRGVSEQMSWQFSNDFVLIKKLQAWIPLKQE